MTKTKGIAAAFDTAFQDPAETVGRLKLVKALVEKGWTQNVGARIDDGRATYPDDPRAVCWCLVGAAIASEPYFKKPAAQETATALGFHAPCAMALWNDRPSRTKAEVLARIDTAIARAEGRSGIGGGA